MIVLYVVWVMNDSAVCVMWVMYDSAVCGVGDV